MRITRIFQPVDLQLQQKIELSHSASHYLMHVLRLPAGSKIIIFNGQGGEFIASIISIKKKICEIQILEYINQTFESTLKLHLVQGIARTDRMDLIIQKAVELGVHTITPLVTEYSEFLLKGERLAKRLEHWRQIIIHACEQCGRNVLPKLEDSKSFADFLASSNEEAKFILHPKGTKSFDALAKIPATISLLIGPEGGFNEQEINLAERMGYQAVNFGPRILRTETAAISAVAVVQYVWGDGK